MATKTLKEYEDFRSGIDTSHEADYLEFINGGTSGGTYTLTPATIDVLGGVKVPADGGIAVNAEGAITLKISTDFDIDATGTLILTGGGAGGGSYTLPYASSTVLGGVKVGTGLAIDGSGVLSATGGGGTPASGDAITKTFTMAGHSFVVGQSLSRSPTGWVLGFAGTDLHAEIAGIVSAVTTDTFTLTLMGYMSGFANLVDGSTYYLSDTTAGDYTDISPSAVDTVSKPLFIAISSTEALVIQSRGILN